jgi:ribosomal protein L37AE/L43A
MEACAFDLYLTQIAQLSRAQCMRVLALLKPAVDQGRTAAVIEDAIAPRLCCPRCQGKQLYRHGTRSGLQRFRCRACGRTFNSLTGTPLARLRHKDNGLISALACLIHAPCAKPRHVSRSPRTQACAGVIDF